MKESEILKNYQKAINDIDDFLEYEYNSYTPNQIKEEIMKIIDNLTKKLAKPNP